MVEHLNSKEGEEKKSMKMSNINQTPKQNISESNSVNEIIESPRFIVIKSLKETSFAKLSPAFFFFKLKNIFSHRANPL